MYYETITTLRSNILKRIDVLQQQLSTLPAGELICCKNRKYTSYYLSNGSKPIYLNKKQKQLIFDLALKKYLLSQIHDLNIELHSLDRYLSDYSKSAHKHEALERDPSFCSLLQTSLQHTTSSLSEEIQSWINAPFEQNKNYPEQLTHPTLAKHYVRSKSEVIIANALFTSAIPYRYEAILPLNNIRFSPDFTILHPKTQKLYYWEHLGMMDMREYSDKAYDKLKIYAHHGIIPSINLITTHETLKVPLDSAYVYDIIQKTFL